MSVYFNGAVLTVPGAYSSVDVKSTVTKSDDSSSKIIALLGECDGGEPESVQFFTEPSIAKRVLKGGNLLKACDKAWNPVSASKEGVKIGGANTIACIRTNKATQSKLEVKKSSDVQVELVSKDWGADTQYQVKLQNGTSDGTKKLVVFDQLTNTYETFDNLGDLFTIKYTGSQEYAEVVVANQGGDLYLITKVGTNSGDAEEDLKVKLDTRVFKTIKALVDYLKGYENYEFVLSSKHNAYLSVADVDPIEKKEIKAATRITAVCADISDRLGRNSQFIKVSKYDNSKGELENFGYKVMSGGTKGSTDSSWIKYFDMLSNFDISYIVPLTADASIHAELSSYVDRLSGVMGRERRAVVGGDSGEPISKTVERARALASSRMQVVNGGFYDYNEDNQLVLYPPYILAAQHAGRVASLPDGESATRDVYRMVSPETKLTGSDVEELLQNGCLAFEFVLGKAGTKASFVRLVHDLTTNVFATSSVYTERATGELADSLNKEIRSELDRLFTGKRTSKTDVTSIKNKVISILFNRKQKEYIVDYKDVYVAKTGNVTAIDYSVAPSEPNNFTLINAHYYSESIVAE